MPYHRPVEYAELTDAKEVHQTAKAILLNVLTESNTYAEKWFSQTAVIKDDNRFYLKVWHLEKFQDEINEIIQVESTREF